MSHHSQQHHYKIKQNFVLTFRIALEASLSPGSIVCLFNVPNWLVHATGINNEHNFMVLLSIKKKNWGGVVHLLVFKVKSRNCIVCSSLYPQTVTRECFKT